MHRAIVSPAEVTADRITIRDPEQLHHLLRVARVRPGEELECVDGTGGRYAGRVIRRTSTQLVVQISQRNHVPPPPCAVTLAQALIRPERFEWVVQKATELGVARLLPLRTARTVIRLTAEQGERKAARWQRIAEEAAKQCGQPLIPQIEAPQSLAELVSRLREWPLAIMPTLVLRQAQDERPERSRGTLAVPTVPLKQALADSLPPSVLVLIGPEGDFTREEALLAQRAGARPVSLGRLTLRSETAALATLAILQLA